MEEVGARVAPPVVIHQTLAQRFCNIEKKRSLPFHSPSFGHQSTQDNWNPSSWNWDSARFVAKPLQFDGVQVGSSRQIPADVSRRTQFTKSDQMGENDDHFRLKLDYVEGGTSLVEEAQPVSRPNKRVRSGSPGNANHPRCQVDDCKEDLSTAKDYHRRHKVCEVHSKASQAVVGKQIQRFCQQCSRFHPLSEFDDGKRSCRRRLAGHNRRRRKTQPEDSNPQALVAGSPQKNTNYDVDIINLLAMLARAQGNSKDMNDKSPSIPEKEQVIQILSKINSLPLPENIAGQLPHLKAPNLVRSENGNQVSGNASSRSTMDLLAVLSTTPGPPSSDAFEIQSPPSTEGSDTERSKSPYVDQSTCLNLQRESMTERPSAGGERSYHSPMEEVDCHVQETSPSVHLHVFSSSPEDNSSRKFPLGGNYLSSNSSNPSAERSPVSSPPLVHDLFPMQTSRKEDCLSNSEEELAYVKSTVSNGCNTSFQLFGSSIQAAENCSIQSSPHRTTGYSICSSGSDHSPPSLSSDGQDRTGRIIFKLFDKDPSHLPGSLRTQIYNWLSNSPSEMESYIKPGCIVLSLYLSMPSIAWDQLDENLLKYVKSLVKDIDVDFWGNGRFLVCSDRQMVSHKDGKIRICKSWRGWSTPELISVSPVAVVAGQETSLILKGRRLTAPGTRVNCTHADRCNIEEVHQASCQDDVTSLVSFKISGTASNMLGRCFIEVDNSFKGTTFPVIIADNTICQELRLLEPVIGDTPEGSTREEALHYLNELGWLFQRKSNSSLFGTPDYRVARFKFLLIFSVEHDFSALIKTLLDILVELNLGREGLATESFSMLSDIHLLNRAVKRRCRRMVDLLIHYSIMDDSNKFIFVPDVPGPGGVTPLHLAACTSSSDDLVHALTSDPQQIGLQSWNSVLDANGLSPYAYASMRNNHSYNTLVARKLADRKTGQITVSIGNEIEPFNIEADYAATTSIKSCSKCAVVAAYGYSKRRGSQGLLHRPYIHSMLVVATVCVCVCVFLRGHPYIGSVSPFAWENLGYGAF